MLSTCAEPLATASIGQVHRATLPDGRRLAIKVQYPGVAESIDSDVDNVATLLRVSGLLPRGLGIAPLLDEPVEHVLAHDVVDLARLVDETAGHQIVAAVLEEQSFDEREIR